MDSTGYSADGHSADVDLDEDRLVWIMGSSRSGSTWLLRMLCELDDATGIDDPHLGHHLGVWRPIPLAWAAGAKRPEPSTLDQVRGEKESYFFNERFAQAWRPLLRDLILGRFDAQVTKPGPVFVKEPASQAAELILSLFPRSRLVFLLRDGRDVVDSWLSAYQDGSWAQDEGAFPLADEGRDAFIRWQASVWAYRTETVAHAFGRHDPSRRVLIRYEDLLDDPVAQLARICEAIGKPSDYERLEQIAAMHDLESVPDSARGDGEHIRAARPGGWREHLTPAEQRAVMEELGETLVSFGYPIREAPALALPDRAPEGVPTP
jgi:LPS sulfotransferase NodH